MLAKKLKKDSLINVLIFILWVAFIGASTDGWASTGGVWGQQILQDNIFQKLFLQPFFFSSKKMLSGFEVLMLTISVYILLKYKGIYINKGIKFLIISMSAVIFITLINPNNDLKLADIFLHEEIRLFYLFILFLFALSKYDEENRIEFILTIFRIGNIIVLISALYYLVFFVSGNGMVWLGRNVTVTYGDTLRWMTIFQVLNFILFIETKDKKHAIYSLVLLIVLFFSYRRSSLFIAILLDICIFVLSRIKLQKIVFKSGYVLKSIIVFFAFISILSFITPKDLKDDFIYRYLGAFSYFSNEYGSEAYNDSGHLIESLITTEYMWKTVFNRVWGGGIGSDSRIYAGEGSTKIHNSFVYVWARYGLYMTFYYLLILGILIFKFKSIASLYLRTELSLIVPGASLFLLVYFTIGWFNGSAFTDYLQTMIMMALIFQVMYFKITKVDLIDKVKYSR